MKSIYFLSKFDAFLILVIICLLIAGDVLFIAGFLHFALSASVDWVITAGFFAAGFLGCFNSTLILLHIEAKNTI